MEDIVFPSDGYAVDSQVQWHGLVPDDEVIRLRPRPGEDTLRTDDVLAVIAENADGLKHARVGQRTSNILKRHALVKTHGSGKALHKRVRRLAETSAPKCACVWLFAHLSLPGCVFGLVPAK